MANGREALASRPGASTGRTENQGQPWTATLSTLQLLHDFGIDPSSERVRWAVAPVREHCRWEHAGQPFFEGEVEPCINGRVVTLVYFGQDVDGVVARLLDEQLEDGGWNCEAENGSVRSSFATTINVLEGLLAHERATGGSPDSNRGAKGEISLSKAIESLEAAQQWAMAIRPKVGGFPYLAKVPRQAGVTRNLWFLAYSLRMTGR